MVNNFHLKNFVLVKIEQTMHISTINIPVSSQPDHHVNLIFDQSLFALTFQMRKLYEFDVAIVAMFRNYYVPGHDCLASIEMKTMLRKLELMADFRLFHLHGGCALVIEVVLVVAALKKCINGYDYGHRMDKERSWPGG